MIREGWRRARIAIAVRDVLSAGAAPRVRGDLVWVRPLGGPGFAGLHLFELWNAAPPVPGPEAIAGEALELLDEWTETPETAA